MARREACRQALVVPRGWQEMGECLCALACNPFVRAVMLTIKGQGSLHGGLKLLQQFQQYQPQAEPKHSVCECVSAYTQCTQQAVVAHLKMSAFSL